MATNVWVGFQGLGDVVSVYQGEVGEIIRVRTLTEKIQRAASIQVQAIMGDWITLDDTYRNAVVLMPACQAVKSLAVWLLSPAATARQRSQAIWEIGKSPLGCAEGSIENQDAKLADVQAKAETTSASAGKGNAGHCIGRRHHRRRGRILYDPGPFRPVKETAQVALRLAEGDLTVPQIQVRNARRNRRLGVGL